MNNLLLLTLLLALPLVTFSQEGSKPDVIRYKATLIPYLEKQSIEGNVAITFVPLEANHIILDCGDLTVSEVIGPHIKNFRQDGNQLMIDLSDQSIKQTHVDISYSGSPKRGLIFNKNLAYTVFSTDQWMVCNMDPSDKARLSLDIIAPDSLEVISSSANQNSETPAYTFGFAIGLFNKYSSVSNDIVLNYYSNHYSEKQLTTVFKETPEILAFLEEKSGISYSQGSYSQVLAGDHYQELDGFSMIKGSYGNLVLADSTETNLITHELAHQWWGNQITCKDWGHFWLNEGFATFLSAAYNEFRFGKKKYQSNIESYYNVYKKIKEKGADKPLVFPNWNNPSKDDRNLVYFKGAYVLHLLKERLGDDLFWKGIKQYSQENFGKSVTTKDFQKAMELASNQNLREFFEEWVYNFIDSER